MILKEEMKQFIRLSSKTGIMAISLDLNIKKEKHKYEVRSFLEEIAAENDLEIIDFLDVRRLKEKSLIFVDYNMLTLNEGYFLYGLLDKFFRVPKGTFFVVIGRKKMPDEMLYDLIFNYNLDLDNPPYTLLTKPLYKKLFAIYTSESLQQEEKNVLVQQLNVDRHILDMFERFMQKHALKNKELVTSS